MNEYCVRFLCFVPLDATGAGLFAFPQYIAGLALMVLAWNVADVRYRFRTQTAPLPLRRITFGVVVTVGCLTLLTDLWRAEHWYVPRGSLLTPAEWQTILAAAYLLNFLTWAWFAFMAPPIYARRNAKRYANVLFHLILKGSSSELAVIADELTHSAESLIKYATDWNALKRRRSAGEDDIERPKLPEVAEYANDILLLIANPRFCRTIVDSSPGTAWGFFEVIGETKKYGVQIGIFARNMLNEAVANKDSFIYSEAEGYESGLVGFHKPFDASDVLPTMKWSRAFARCLIRTSGREAGGTASSGKLIAVRS